MVMRPAIAGLVNRSSVGLADVLRLSPYKMYDVSVLSSLYQDSAKTTPVTAIGDLVGAVEDLTGSSASYTALSPTNRPVYAEGANGQKYLSFNGVNTRLISSALTFMHNGTGGMVFGTMQAGTSSNPNAVYGLCGSSGGSTANIGFQVFYDDRSGSGFSDAARFTVTRGVVGQATFQLTGQDDATPNVCQVWGASYDGTDSPEARVYINGVQVETAVEDYTPSSSIASFNSEWGGLGNSNLTLLGRSGVLIFFDRIPNEQELTIINAYLTSRKWT